MRAYLEKASKHMKKWANKKRHPFEFRVGDQVLIKLRLEQIWFWSCKDQRLIRKYEGSVEVFKKIENALYRVVLPAWMKIHLVIHVNSLKPYYPDPDNDHRNTAIWLGMDLKHKDEKEVKEILTNRVRKFGRPTWRIYEFLVKWENLLVQETSWERLEGLEASYLKIEEVKLRQSTETSTV